MLLGWVRWVRVCWRGCAALRLAVQAEVDLNKRAGELTEEELEAIKLIIAQPLQFNIPTWFLNNQKDHKDGKYSQVRRRRREDGRAISTPER